MFEKSQTLRLSQSVSALSPQQPPTFAVPHIIFSASVFQVARGSCISSPSYWQCANAITPRLFTPHPGTQHGVARILSNADRGQSAAALTLCPQRCARAAVNPELRALRSRGSRQGSPNPGWALAVIPAPWRPCAPSRQPRPAAAGCRRSPLSAGSGLPPARRLSARLAALNGFLCGVQSAGPRAAVWHRAGICPGPAPRLALCSSRLERGRSSR